MATPDDPMNSPDHDPFAPAFEEDAAGLSLFQEINERRAQVENAELLQHLRGL